MKKALFTNRVLNVWNSLQAAIVLSHNVSTSECRIAKSNRHRFLHDSWLLLLLYLFYCSLMMTMHVIGCFTPGRRRPFSVVGPRACMQHSPGFYPGSAISTDRFRRVLKTYLFARYYVHPAHWGFFNDNALYRFTYLLSSIKLS